jgi:hypothetical protein
MHDTAAIRDELEPSFQDQGDDAFRRLHAVSAQVSRRPTHRQRQSN